MRPTTAHLAGTRTPMFAVSNYLAIRFRPLTLTIYHRLYQTVWHLGLHHYTVTYPQIPGPWTRLIYAYRSNFTTGLSGLLPHTSLQSPKISGSFSMTWKGNGSLS